LDLFTPKGHKETFNKIWKEAKFTAHTLTVVKFIAQKLAIRISSAFNSFESYHFGKQSCGEKKAPFFRKYIALSTYRVHSS
jgi:hypothetical protein